MEPTIIESNLNSNLNSNTNSIFDQIKKNVVEYFPKYRVIEMEGEIVKPEERLPMGATLACAFQHVMSMFGSVVVCPLLMGFNSNLGLFFSGIGTIIFFICTGGRVPSYVGASFAFISVVNSATGYTYVAGGPGNPNIGIATGGIIVCGIFYLAISLAVMIFGYKWLEILMPPTVTGAVVMSIGLNLSISAIKQAASTGFDAWMAMVTVVSTSMITVYAPGPLKRLPILIGGLFSYLVYLFFGLGGVGPGIDFSGVKNAQWIGMPPFHKPQFQGTAISMITPVAIILAAENIGHIKAVGSMTGRNIDNLLGRAFLGDSIATIVAATFGSVGTTTYAENIGVMSITKIFSTFTFLFAAGIAIILGILPIFGAIIGTIPAGIFGGLSIILFGIIGMTGAKIWINNQTDLSKPRNLLTAGVAIVLGCGMVEGLSINWGNIKIDGIGASTLSSIILYQLLRDDWSKLFIKLLCKITGRNYGDSTIDHYKPLINDDEEINDNETIIDNNNIGEYTPPPFISSNNINYQINMTIFLEGHPELLKLRITISQKMESDSIYQTISNLPNLRYLDAPVVPLLQHTEFRFPRQLDTLKIYRKFNWNLNAETESEVEENLDMTPLVDSFSGSGSCSTSSKHVILETEGDTSQYLKLLDQFVSHLARSDQLESIILIHKFDEENAYNPSLDFDVSNYPNRKISIIPYREKNIIIITKQPPIRGHY
eukprot:gene8369-10281_t